MKGEILTQRQRERRRTDAACAALFSRLREQHPGVSANRICETMVVFHRDTVPYRSVWGLKIALRRAGLHL